MLPSSHSGNKPGMSETVKAGSEIDTGGERRVSYPDENRPELSKPGRNNHPFPPGFTPRGEEYSCSGMSDYLLV